MEEQEYFALRQLEGRHWWLRGLRQLAWTMLERHRLSGSGPRILDLGCGTGGMLRFVRERLAGARLFGLDRHPIAIEFSREQQPGTLCRGTVEALPFGQGAFDAVLLLDVLYTRGVNDVQALHEAYRVLAIGGLLVVNLPAFEILEGRHDVAVHAGHRYTAGELGKKLNGAGFEIVRLTYWNMFLAPAVLVKRRLLERARAAGDSQSDLAPLPVVVNAVLGAILRFERAMISYVSLPFGSSVFAVARKPNASRESPDPPVPRS